MKRVHVLYLAAALSGVLTWIVITAITGRNEAWDTGLYFALGVPVVCIVAFVLAMLEPDRSWRWGLLPVAGQALWMLVSQGPGNLLPLGLVVFAVLAVPSIVTARVGAWIATRSKRGAG